MKKISLIFLSVLLIFTLAACGNKCEHTYDNACDAICNDCEETREVGAHDFAAADCDTAKTCKNCGATEGEKLNFFMSIWLAIITFFKKLFGIK